MVFSRCFRVFERSLYALIDVVLQKSRSKTSDSQNQRNNTICVPENTDAKVPTKARRQNRRLFEELFVSVFFANILSFTILWLRDAGDTDQAQEFQADPFLVNCEFEAGIAYTLLGKG